MGGHRHPGPLMYVTAHGGVVGPTKAFESLIEACYSSPTWVYAGGLCGRHSHGVSPRDSHEISPTIGGVHKLMILLRDLVMENLQKNIFVQ